MKKILICGSTGFIGRNIFELFQKEKEFQVIGVHHTDFDLTNREDILKLFSVVEPDVIIQAAATTSGSKDIITRPYYHVTDNAVMNSLLLREAYEQGVSHFIFFSCTVMYPITRRVAKESDFDGNIGEKYFGVGWTKVYLEKMCEFYSRLGKTQFTVIRHSNIYGPYDKFDLDKSHVFGATVAKVMDSNGSIAVWGDGTEERDLLYVDDLVRFVRLVIDKQKSPFELVNVGSGESISVTELVRKIIIACGKEGTEIKYDLTKPTIPTKLTLDCAKAKEKFRWKPQVSLDEGIKRTVDWYKEAYEKV